MRTFIKIARQELSTLFHSPVAWLILMVFPIQVGMDYAYYMLMLGRSQRMGNHFTEVTNIVFASKQGFYAGVKNTLYFYIPLLTMGLISRELHSGSIKLLLSSPIKVKDIVLGKYLAMMGYGFILIVIIGMFAYSGSFFIENIDYLQLISGAFGLYLLICAYAAIGLFMSSLTSYQVVAAISTLAVLGLLNFIGGLFQGNDVMRHITYFLSITGRTEQFINGIISSEDVIYFLLTISFFLFLTAMRLQASREAKSFGTKFMRYVVLAAGCFIVGYISSRPRLTGYIDMTLTKSRTLSDKSIAYLRKMDKPLKITTYVNILDNNFYLGAPEVKSTDERLFNQYRRFLPDLKMEYVYYYAIADNRNLNKSNRGVNLVEMAKKVADIQGMDFKQLLSPDQVSKQVNLGPEENRLVRLLEYGDKKTFLRYYDDMRMYASEQEITAAIKRMMEPEKVPVITFLTGHNERSSRRSGDADLRKAASELTFRYSLVNQGFDVDTVNLADQDISPATAVLVIADPKEALAANEADKIKQYIESGRDLLVLYELNSEALVAPILQHIGISGDKTLLTQQSKDFAPDLVQALFTNEADVFSDRYKQLRLDSAIVTMPGVSAMHYSRQEFNIIPLLAKNQSATAVALSRARGGKQQKIMIASDADFMSTAELSRRNPENRNFAFITGLFTWFSNGEFPVNTAGPRSRDSIDSNDHSIMMLRIFFFGILPACFLIAGATLLIYRKRR